MPKPIKKQDMERKFIVTRDQKLCYIGNAKAASSTILNLIFYYDHAFSYPYGNIYRSNHAFKRWPVEHVNTAQKLLTFSFVRNPFRRILSCFFSKVVSESDPNYFFLRDLLTGQYDLDPTGNKVDNFKKFLNFLENEFEKKTNEAINTHWRPQITNLCPDNPRLDRIGRVETFNAQIVKILNEVEAPLHTYDFVQQMYNSTGSSKLDLSEFFDSRAIDLIKNLYQLDFEAFGYSIQPEQENNLGQGFITWRPVNVLATV